MTEVDYPYAAVDGYWSYEGRTLDKLPEAVSTQLLGKTLLVGVTYFDHSGNEVENGGIADERPVA